MIKVGGRGRLFLRRLATLLLFIQRSGICFPADSQPILTSQAGKSKEVAERSEKGATDPQQRSNDEKEEPGAEISGRVVDIDGKPVFLAEVTLMREDLDIAQDSVATYSDLTEEDGTYRITGIPSGRYLLGINITEPPSTKVPYPRTYYPDAPVRFQAKAIQIGVEQKLTNYDFHLPAPFPERPIEVTVQWSDGRPADGAYVYLHNPEYPWEVVVAEGVQRTNSAGHLTVKGLEGLRYWFHAEMSLEDGKQMCASPVSMFINATATAIRLVLATARDSCAYDYSEGPSQRKKPRFRRQLNPSRRDSSPAADSERRYFGAGLRRGQNPTLPGSSPWKVRAESRALDGPFVRALEGWWPWGASLRTIV